VRTGDARAGRVFQALATAAALLSLFCFATGARLLSPEGFCGYISTEEMLVGGAALAFAVSLLGVTIMAAVVYRGGAHGLPEDRRLVPRLKRDQFGPRGRRAR